MQLTISWNQYFVYMGVAIVIYYAFIIVRFYGKEILHIKFPQAATKKNIFSNQGSLFTGIVPGEPVETDQNPLFPVVNDFVDELKVLLKQSAVQQSGKSEITTAVSKLLQKYPALKRSAFQVSITHLIAAESETNCNIRLSADELASVWN